MRSRSAAVVGSFALVTASAALAAPIAAAQSTLGGYRSFIAPVSAAATFTVPAVDCSPIAPAGFQGVALGASLHIPAPAGQTASTGVGVVLICVPSGPIYQAFGQINGISQSPSLTVQPGDTIVASAAENSAGTTISLADSSDNGGAPQVLTGTGGTPQWAGDGAISLNCSAAFGPCSPVPKLTGPVTFSSVAINGVRPLFALAYRSNLTAQSGSVQISTSPAGVGRSFTTTWASSCGFGSARC